MESIKIKDQSLESFLPTVAPLKSDERTHRRPPAGKTRTEDCRVSQHLATTPCKRWSTTIDDDDDDDDNDDGDGAKLPACSMRQAPQSAQFRP